MAASRPCAFTDPTLRYRTLPPPPAPPSPSPPPLFASHPLTPPQNSPRLRRPVSAIYSAADRNRFEGRGRRAPPRDASPFEFRSGSPNGILSLPLMSVGLQPPSCACQGPRREKSHGPPPLSSPPSSPSPPVLFSPLIPSPRLSLHLTTRTLSCKKAEISTLKKTKKHFPLPYWSSCIGSSSP